MKKLATFLITILYMSFNVGATLHLHYCMGEHVATSLFNLNNRDCGKCGMDKHSEENNGCCKDQSVTIKASDAHTQSIPYDHVSPVAQHIEAPPFQAQIFLLTEDRYTPFTRHTSPPVLKKPLYIKYCSHRI